MAKKKDKLQQLREEQERLLIKIRQAVEDNYSSMLNVPGVKQAVSDKKSDFFFSQNGAVNKAIGRIIDRMAKKMNATLLNGVEKHWEQGSSNLWDELEAVNAKTADEKKAFDQIRERATQSVRNSAKSFYNEKRAGLSVSDRVWNLAGNSKKEMEIIIQKGIQEGKTVDEIQKGLKQYLNDPDKLFRRVVNKETGELELSKAAKLYKPGRGVYRSAYKNAMRLARTEMNAAYRQAEWESYQNNPLIVGYKIMLSNNHTTLINGVPTPFHCICDDLQGDYPKSFKWLGWHPQCRCTMSPILITQNERKDLYKSIFDGKRKNWKPQQITDYPKAFTDWIDKNKDRQNDWSSTPYFIRDNFKDGLLVNGLNVPEPVSKKPIKTDQQKADIQARWNARVAGRKHGVHLNDLRAKYGKESDTITRMVIQIRNQITKGIGLTDVDKIVDKLNHKVQVKIAWDERAEINELETLLVDVKGLKTKFDMPTIKTVFNAVQTKLDGWKSLSLDQQLNKLKFEIDWVEKNKKYDTWKPAQDAYKKQLAKVEFGMLEKEIDLLMESAKAIKPKGNSKLAILLKTKSISKEYMNSISTEMDALLIRRNKSVKGNLENIPEKEITRLLEEFDSKTTVDGADKKLRGLAETVWKTLTKQERYVLTKYTQTFNYLNEPLRGLPYYGSMTPNADHVRDLPILTQALSKFKMPENFVVRRGTGNFTIKELGYGIDKLKAGDVFTEKAFLSTAIHKTKGFSQSFNFVIVVPKGAQGFYAEPFSHYTDSGKFSHNGSVNKAKLWDGISKEQIRSEQEWIGQRGSQFKVLKRVGNTIYLQMIGQMQ